MTFISYAQNFEDVLLRRALKWVRDGFYIDVGAQHPDINSVTRAFYDQGWSGINVEPVPEARAGCARPARATSPSNSRSAPSEGEATLFVVGGTGLSSLDAGASRKAEAHGFVAEERRTPVSTLAAICREHVRGPIHFLKIDVEGAEASGARRRRLRSLPALDRPGGGDRPALQRAVPRRRGKAGCSLLVTGSPGSTG